MKTFFSHISYRTLLIIAVLTEVAMGLAQAGVVAIRSAESAWFIVPLYLFQCLHIILSVAVLCGALQCVNHHHLGRGIIGIVILIVALFFKGFLATYFNLTLGEGKLIGDAILLSLGATALSTLLFTSLFLFAVFFLGHLFFVYRRPTTEIPADPWALKTGPLLGASFLTAVLITLPEWVLAIINQIDFLASDVIGFPTGPELATILFEFFAIPLFGLAAYLLSHALICHGMRDVTNKKDGAVDTAEKNNIK